MLITAIADRLRMVSMSNNSNQTDVVNRFTDPIFPLPALAVLSKEALSIHLKIIISLIKTEDQQPTKEMSKFQFNEQLDRKRNLYKNLMNSQNFFFFVANGSAVIRILSFRF